MGNTSSTVGVPPSSGRGSINNVGDGRPKYGYQILHIEPNSPASNVRLIPYFDYIASVNGVIVIQESPNVVAEMAASNIDKPLRFVIFNSKNDSLREITIIPSRKWGGATLLGASIRFSRFDDASFRVWHILEVHESSPAANSGLIPLDDWIIGSPDVCIYSEDDFYNLLIHNVNKSVKMIIYNLRSDSCREIVIVPNFQWGGAGCLGCDVGGGILHKIPTENAAFRQATHTNNPPPPAISPNQSNLATLSTPLSHQNSNHETISTMTNPASNLPMAPTSTTATLGTATLNPIDNLNFVNNNANPNSLIFGQGEGIAPFIVTHGMADSPSNPSNESAKGNDTRERGEQGSRMPSSITNSSTLYGVQDVPPFLTTHAQAPASFYNVSKEELNLLPSDEEKERNYQFNNFSKNNNGNNDGSNNGSRQRESIKETNSNDDEKIHRAELLYQDNESFSFGKDKNEKKEGMEEGKRDKRGKESVGGEINQTAESFFDSIGKNNANGTGNASFFA